MPIRLINSFARLGNLLEVQRVCGDALIERSLPVADASAAYKIANRILTEEESG